MANPDYETTTVNVKGMSVEAWKRGKTAADALNETMGVWLSRAMNRQVDAEAQGRFFTPANPRDSRPEAPSPVAASPLLLSVDQLAALLQGMAALTTASGVTPAKTDVRRAYHLVDDIVRQGRGLPPRRVRGGISSGVARLE